MESSEITIAEALQKNGYKTAYIGKWHLGDEAWYPEKQGYDENFWRLRLWATSVFLIPTITPKINILLFKLESANSQEEEGRVPNSAKKRMKR